MSELGWVHLVFSLVAVGAGGFVFLIPKGTRWHRTVGHAYVMSMIGVVVTAFSIYDLTGSFGPFHIAAIVAGFTLVGGLTSVLLRRPRKNWIEAHAVWMSWSYTGLLAALAAESLTRFVMPRVAAALERTGQWTAFWITVVIASFLIMAGGWWLIRTRLAAAVARTPAAMRRERLRSEPASRLIRGVAPRPDAHAEQ